MPSKERQQETVRAMFQTFITETLEGRNLHGHTIQPVSETSR